MQLIIIILMVWLYLFITQFWHNINMTQFWGREFWDLKKIISINSYYVNRDPKMNSRKCEIRKVDIHRASYVKHLRSKKHIENEKK